MIWFLTAFAISSANAPEMAFVIGAQAHRIEWATKTCGRRSSSSEQRLIATGRRLGLVHFFRGRRAAEIETSHRLRETGSQALCAEYLDQLSAGAE